ncbi:MAG: aminomethyltransferase family protein [Acidobacteriota bacterium]
MTKRSPLYEDQKALGARFGLFDGWEMAQSYSGTAEEHLAVRTNAGLIDLCHYGALKIWGGEAVQFLNGLVTNDVKSLPAGKGMRAAFLTGHGKVRALCRVLNLGKEFLVINNPQTHDKVFKYVSPFSYAGDFKAEDVSEQYLTLSVQGPKSHLIMKEVCFEPVPSLSEYDWIETLIAGHRALLSRVSHTGELGFDILVPASALKDVWDFILLKGHFHSLVPFGLWALESLRIEAGIPVYGVDIDETNMMLETGLEDAVSFNKGCYTGQEAVAMATYRGHVSKKLSGLTIEGDTVPDRGDIVRKDGKEIGLITSTGRSLSVGSTIALAYLKYGFFQPGNTVEVKTEAGVLSALVVELPFHRGV